MTKKINRLSVSQLEAFKRNPMYWANAYWYKLPRAGSEALDFGIKAHEDFSSFLNTGELSDNEEVNKYLNEFIKEGVFNNSLTKIESEKMIQFKLEAVCPLFVGILDVLIEDWGPRGTALISDFKFMGSHKFAPSAYELKSNIQLLTYGYWYLLQRGTEDPGVWLQHVHFYRRDKVDGMHMSIKRTYVSRERIERFIENELIPRCETIIYTSERESFNTEKCCKCRFAYGKNSCEYWPICSRIVSIPEYIVLYNVLKHCGGGKTPYSWQLNQAANNYKIIKEVKKISSSLLTEKASIDIIKSEVAKMVKAYISDNLKTEVKMSTSDKNNTQMKRFYKELRSPVADAVFSHVTAPTENLRGAMQYEINLKLDPSNDEHRSFISEMSEAAAEAQKFVSDTGSTSEFRTLTWRADKDKEGNQTGKVLLKLTSKKKPVVLSANGSILDLDQEIAMNTPVQARFLVASYDVGGNAGITNYLDTVIISSTGLDNTGSGKGGGDTKAA